MLEAAKTRESREVRLIDAAIAAGVRLAREAGREDPALQDAVWELLLEAMATLRSLPNRERGWLTAASRAHWPEYLRSSAAELSSGAVRPAIASAGAIDRMDTVLPWLPQAGGTNARRDVSILFGLACGLKVVTLRKRFGCGRRTVYDVRDRGIARICGWLRQQSELCGGMQ